MEAYKGKTQTVEFVKFHVMYAHDVGDVVTLRDEDAAELIKGKYAVPVKEAPKTPENK